MRWGPTALRKALLGSAVLGATCWISCERLPTGPGRASTSGIRGFTLSAWSRIAYETPESEATVDRLRALGSSHVMLLTTAYQATRHSSSVAIDSVLTPSMPSLSAAAQFAASRNMALAVKPHVDVRDGSWRGTIDPGNPPEWFDSYRAYLLPLADFAESVGAVQFIVGTELALTVRHEGEWKATIAMVRSRFSGTIVYAASWDECTIVPFWSALDLVGIDAYFPITVRPDGGRFEILAGWQPWLDRMEQLHRKTGKPILVTEIGYRSVDGAGMAPYDFRSTGKPDPLEQADLYWGAIEALGSQNWIEGMYWWSVRPGGPVDGQNTEYSPLGKPAEEELRRSWSN